MGSIAATGETQVNTTTVSAQYASAVTGLSDGGWLVTWISFFQDGSGQGIYQQRYSANGQVLGGEIQVNRTTAGDQSDPSVTALSDGGWLVTWRGRDGGDAGIYQQRYTSYGLKVGPETSVNTTIDDFQIKPSAAVLPDGGWVVTWASHMQDGSGYGIYQQRYGADAYPVGNETRVNTTTVNTQEDASVTGLSDGGWLVTWKTSSVGGTSFDIHQQRYDAYGWAIGDEMVVNTTVAGIQSEAAATALKDGGWVVTWTSAGDIYQQRFAANSQKVSGEVLVNTTTDEDQSDASVTVLADGGWLVTWSSGPSTEATNDIFQQRFAANGQKVGGESRINTFAEGDQIESSVAALKDGGWIVTWTSAGQDGDSYGVYQQRYTADGRQVGPTTPTGMSLTDGNVSEGASAGARAGQLTAKSFVADPGSVYTLLNDAGGRFALSQNGVLTVKDGVRLDYEQGRAHQVLVEVKDALGASYRSWLTVSVRDVASESLRGSVGSDVLKGGRYKDGFNGGAGSDKLWGGLGNDMLTGGAGKDSFVFNTKANTKTNRDKIVDFKSSDDSIWLDNAVFTKLGRLGSESRPVQLKKDYFVVGSKAKDKNDYIVYDKAKGVLYYDADGSGKGKAVEIATFSNKATLVLKDFFII